MLPIKSQTPRPAPKFFLDGQTLSTKKERCTPRDNPPPRPPGKTCPPVSRVFSYRPPARAQVVSFKESDSSVLSKFYDENSKLPYFDQCFEVIRKLGSGSFADVYNVRSKEDGKFYAIKRSKERFKGKLDRQRKLKEVQKHEQLPKHKNCIRFYKAWEEKQYLYIQTELCKISLSQYAEENHDIPEYLIWNYLVDLLLALKHLHDHSLVHLDIKPDNIFISEDGICKLGDFGLVLDLSKWYLSYLLEACSYVQPVAKKGDVFCPSNYHSTALISTLSKDDFSDAVEGDPKYLAAELMEGKFSKAADIFSLGITVLELACDLVLPTGDALWHQLRKGNIPSECLARLSPELSKLICLMMEPDYNKRPTVDQILQMNTVSKVMHRRKLMLKLISLVSCFLWLYKGLLLCLFCLKTTIMYPYSHFTSKEKPITPARTARPHPPEWDFSYSDDDVFDDEEHKSLANSLLDSSNESAHNSFNCPSIPERVVSSTPFMYCFPNKNVLGTDPGGSPKLNWNRENSFTCSSPKMRLLSPRSSIRKDGLRKVNSPSIEPKNLMEAFDAESDDDV